ncbi:MAG: tetratricopeptide repeat protein [Candidatus Sulfotelmatobacter sp.]
MMKIVFGILIFWSAVNVAAQDASDQRQKVADLKQQALQYLQQQKPQLAIPIFRQIVSRDPQDVDARGNLGVLLFFQNNYAEAITEMRAALQLNSQLWRIQALLGIAEKRTGDLSAAQSDLEQSFPNIDDVKIQKEAGLELIEIASASGDLDQAGEVVGKLEKIAPQDPQILFAAYQISLQTVDRTLLSMALAAPNSAELHMMMADEFVLQGDSDNAIAQYREAIRLNSRLPGVHFELAVQLKESSDPALKAEAEREFRTALSLNQFDEKAWRGLGEMMADKGNFSAAKEDYTKALALFPQDSDAETDLAKLLVAHGDNQAATSLLESAVKDDPANSVAHYQLSGLYRQAGKTAEAQQEMDEFAHYKAIKDNLGKVFRQMRQEDLPPQTTGKPSTH